MTKDEIVRLSKEEILSKINGKVSRQKAEKLSLEELEFFDNHIIIVEVELSDRKDYYLDTVFEGTMLEYLDKTAFENYFIDIMKEVRQNGYFKDKTGEIVWNYTLKKGVDD